MFASTYCEKTGNLFLTSILSSTDYIICLR
ncbi:hypothetical protein LINPERPRIM_LOCUS40001 [Linum perenne]